MNRKLAEALIERIVVHDIDNVTVTLRFTDEYQNLAKITGEADHG